MPAERVARPRDIAGARWIGPLTYEPDSTSPRLLLNGFVIRWCLNEVVDANTVLDMVVVASANSVHREALVVSSTEFG